jgi:hypothetical protein
MDTDGAGERLKGLHELNGRVVEGRGIWGIHPIGLFGLNGR